MVKYNRLTFVEREEISRYLAAGLSLRAIARTLKRSPSTISREIVHMHNNRNCYRALNAHEYAFKERHKSLHNRKLDNNERLRNLVFYYLTRKCWAPEQIAKRLKILYPNNMYMHISHESIYKYLYVLPRGTLKKEIIRSLRRHHTNRKPRKVRQKSYPIQDYLSIEERPTEVLERTIPGHWEGDLIMGSRNLSALGSLVERTSRYTFLVKLNDKDAESVANAFANEFREVPDGFKHSLTYDQGCEMAAHKLFTKETNIKVYFAHPHSPWERGTSENTNALVRQFFPKGTDFRKISKKRIKEVQELLNDRPRKVHNFYTPNEVFHKLLH